MTVEFSIDSLNIDNNYFDFEYAGLDKLNLNARFSIPVKTVYFSSDYNENANIKVTVVSCEYIGQLPDNLAEYDNLTTGFFDLDESNIKHSLKDFQKAVYSQNSYTDDIDNFKSVSILPITITDNNEIYFNSRILIQYNDDDHLTTRNEIYKEKFQKEKNPVSSAIFKSSSTSGVPLGMDYVIITSVELAPAFEELARFRTATGITAGIAIVDSIYKYYSGFDQPEMIREYLKDFYNAGGQYLLIGGDNIIIPVRYLYYYNTTNGPSDPYYLMPSDLYYGDLTGVWNADGDNFWGEPSDDAPDIVPELLVGRLPIKTIATVTNYIEKLKIYATNPGNGEFDYLNRTLFFTSDEMRDYPAAGQHSVIAGEVPDFLQIDTVNGVEFPSGYDANPTNPSGADGINKISEGFGFINILAHGRIDGFIVKSANYGDWPASLILTADASNGNGSVQNIAKNEKSSLYYSLSCNVGGYDLDSINGQPTNWSLVEKLIEQNSGGAVGMIAYSRWGWVYSSYYLQQSFTEHLYGSANGNPVQAMYSSWLDYPHYRDLIYGQNFFGDPALTVYTDIPDQMKAILENRTDSYQVRMLDGDNPVAGVLVTISDNTGLIESGLTDSEGLLTLTNYLENNTEYTIAGVKDGYTTVYSNFVPSVTLDVNDDDNLLPDEFGLSQNYPNPFNPSTTIKYSLPSTEDVNFTIYNILGQAVYEIDLPFQNPGEHELVWCGTNSWGDHVATGIYFYRMTAGEFVETKKMVIMK
ncbi:MAG: C25 family cysteine peptidase [Candidatus Zixiibacteriota bacterium]